MDASARSRGLAPVGPSSRVLALDVARGLAILGILVVNIGLFSGFQGIAQTYDYGATIEADDAASLAVSVLAEGKFLSALSFLFGLGFFWQAMRAESRGRSSARLLLRRCLGLALIGALHAVFIWSGDILFTYAMLGLVLILFRGRSMRTLLMWAGALIGAPLALMVLAAVFAAVSAGGLAEGGAGAGVLEGLDRSAREAYNSGSYPQMVLQRLHEIGVYAIGGLSIGPALFAAMLCGAAVARAGWLEDLPAHTTALRRAALAGVGIGLPLNAAYAASLVADPAASGAVGLAGQACWFVGAPALALGYISIIALVALANPASGLLTRLSAVGRLALTNYLAQSVAMTAVFYGLSIYGRVGLIPAMLTALAFLALQLIVSPLYLQRFSRGPVEWLWRRMTYGASGAGSG